MAIKMSISYGLMFFWFVFSAMAVEMPCDEMTSIDQWRSRTCSKYLGAISVLNTLNTSVTLRYINPDGSASDNRVITPIVAVGLRYPGKCIGSLYRVIDKNGDCVLQFSVTNHTDRYVLRPVRTCDSPGSSLYSPGEAKKLGIANGMMTIRNSGSGNMIVRRVTFKGKLSAPVQLTGGSTLLPAGALSLRKRTYVGDRWAIFNGCDNRCIRIIEVFGDFDPKGFLRIGVQTDDCNSPTPTPFPVASPEPHQVCDLPGTVRNCSCPGKSLYTPEEAAALGIKTGLMTLRNTGQGRLMMRKIQTDGSFFSFTKLLTTGEAELLPSKVISIDKQTQIGDRWIVYNACDGACLRVIAIKRFDRTGYTRIGVPGYDCVA